MKLFIKSEHQSAKEVAKIDILKAKHYPKTKVHMDLEEALLFGEYSLENELTLISI
jgi:hypothetical protein